MKVKIVTKAGREYYSENEKQVCRCEDGFFNVIIYNNYDDYYQGDAKYKGKNTILSICMSVIESIDYR